MKSDCPQLRHADRRSLLFSTRRKPDVLTGSEAISGVQTLSRSILNDAGQVIAQDDYFNLTGICPAPLKCPMLKD